MQADQQRQRQQHAVRERGAEALHHHLGQALPEQHRAQRGAEQEHQQFGREIAEQETALAERRSEEHTSELQSLMRISYAVFCLKKKKQETTDTNSTSL